MTAAAQDIFRLLQLNRVRSLQSRAEAFSSILDQLHALAPAMFPSANAWLLPRLEVCLTILLSSFPSSSFPRSCVPLVHSLLPIPPFMRTTCSLPSSSFPTEKMTKNDLRHLCSCQRAASPPPLPSPPKI